MTANLLAAAAVVISLISLAFNVEARWLDRHRLRCASHMSTTYGKGQETYAIEVIVTNIGRRPVAVVEVSFQDHNED